MGEYDKNVLPQGVNPLPIIFKKNGYYTFNEGTGKDDFNFEWDSKEFYDRVGGWNFKGAKKVRNGQEEKRATSLVKFNYRGKLGKRAKKITDPSLVPVPPYYPDIALVREIAHHYDCLIETDKELVNYNGLKHDVSTIIQPFFYFRTMVTITLQAVFI